LPRNDTEKAEAETRKKHKAEAKELATDEHGISRKKQKQKHGKESRRKDIFATDEHGKKHCIRFGLMNDFKAHGLRSMGLLVLATE
jgi:hypothetical protein